MVIKELNIEGERVFVKKRMTGYREVFPVRIDGKLNWKNLLIGGSWMHIIKLILIVAIIIVIGISYYHDQEVFREYTENPCEYARQASIKCINNADYPIIPNIIIEDNYYNK